MPSFCYLRSHVPQGCKRAQKTENLLEETCVERLSDVFNYLPRVVLQLPIRDLEDHVSGGDKSVASRCVGFSGEVTRVMSAT